jgi:hypothetical protein
VAFDGGQRAGVLTQGSLMTLLASANQASPILRGKFVREQVLCQSLPPPPNDIMVTPPPLDKNLSTRERFAAHSASPQCVGCHTLMDPIGFGFENFDGTGIWRDTENGKVIDASGEVRGIQGDGHFNGARELGVRLAASEEVRDCATKQWFHYAYGRGHEGAGDDCTLATLEQRFAAGGYKVRDLLVALTDTDAFLYRPVAAGGVN